MRNRRKTPEIIENKKRNGEKKGKVKKR